MRDGFVARLGLAALAACAACSGGSRDRTIYCPVPPWYGDAGAAPAEPNVVPAIVDPGPQDVGYTNGIFASVTLCEPGTGNCQTLNHLLVDTGSTGVRVLESEVKLNLPAATSASGQALAECTPFVDGTAWGPVKIADVRIGGEAAAGLRIQLVGELSYAMPSACTGTPITDLQSLGANGILGVGTYLQDCGPACAQPARSVLNPGPYFSCSNPFGGCTVVAVPLAEQVANPVAAFAVDNNGVILQLPAVPEGGAFSVPGLLFFGIGTQANNGLGSASVFPLDERGYVGTAFPADGTDSYTAYLDSGSNGLYFLDEATSGIRSCSGNLKDFYCPAATTNLSARIFAIDGTSAAIDFRVADVSKLDVCAFAFDDLAGPMPGFPDDTGVPAFDWGLPFFFGRSVYVSIEKQSTPAGPGPYFAF
ncbi:MAG: DUF3443 family protein [Deltaproteobacteria bacterium]|jgi:hypothetical protein|nr:DUF3443 family protein [Deltaproteobacteria bacterium]